MIHYYADCTVVVCDTCRRELSVSYNFVPTQYMFDAEHYCKDHEPSCADCGCSLVDQPRFPAHDITPDGQETWLRCELCSAIRMRDDVLRLIQLDGGNAVRHFAAQRGIVKLPRAAGSVEEAVGSESETAA